MYGDELVVPFARISQGDAKVFGEAVDRWNIRWAIIPNRSERLIALLDRTPSWRRLKRDRVGSIYVREVP